MPCNRLIGKAKSAYPVADAIPEQVGRGGNMQLRQVQLSQWLRAAMAVAALALGIGAAHAEDMAARKPVPQVALDGPKVEKFLETWGLVTEEIEQRDSDFDGGDTETLIDQLQAMHETAATDAAMTSVVKGHGYASFDEWVATSYTILVSHQWVENPPDAEEFAKARAAIEKMDGMSEDQKREMLASLQDALGVVSEMEPTADNKEAVAPYLKEIASVLEAGGEKQGE